MTKLNDTEYSLCTNYTEEQLTEWLEKSEDTGHHRGYARHHKRMNGCKTSLGNIDCSNKDQAGLRSCLFLCLRNQLLRAALSHSHSDTLRYQLLRAALSHSHQIQKHMQLAGSVVCHNTLC